MIKRYIGRIKHYERAVRYLVLYIQLVENLFYYYPSFETSHNEAWRLHERVKELVDELLDNL